MPNKKVDITKWAVVACDQFTSQPDYWAETERIVGDAPSTLRITLPEIYLEKPGEAERIEKINATMDEYVANGILEDKGEGFVFIRRSCEGKTRTGLVIALDLEDYDYTKGSTTLIRATEGTIVERIPPRLRIRENAPLETPHILVLIDDPERTVIEPIANELKNAEKLYDFDLMQNGGHIEGYFVNDEAVIKKAINAMAALIEPEKYKAQYGDKAPLLFALGDGNHSFATAKANWEKKKVGLTAEEMENHPARFALVELENVHDEGIVFEPIHRVMFNLDTEKAIKWLEAKLTEQNGNCEIKRFPNKDAYERAMKKLDKANAHIIPFITARSYGYIKVVNPVAQLEVGTLQNALDIMLKEMDGAVIDYVHGADVVEQLSRKKNNMGFLLPAMDKSAFFKTVVFDGSLPRKTFSMGEANEKRYYLECRKIK